MDELESRRSHTPSSSFSAPSLSLSTPSPAFSPLILVRSASPAASLSRGPSPLSFSRSVTPTSTVSSGGSSRSTSPVNPERDNYEVDRIVNCWKCNETFPSRKALLRHLKEHNVDLPFKCYLCDASFSTRIESLQHKMGNHPSDWLILREKNQIPAQSEEKFTQYVDKMVDKIVQSEMRGLRGDVEGKPDYLQRKVFCSLCPKRFWSLQDLRRHMRSHTGL